MDGQSGEGYAINMFKACTTICGGFYIGRYEQGTGNVCKGGVEPYFNVSKNKAKNEAEAMYSENNYVSSELVCSYAWDTALNFICQTNSARYKLAMTTDDKYANLGTGTRTNTGAYASDNYSNIYDFLGNCMEWTTEKGNNTNAKDVIRGGSYDENNSFCASIRSNRDGSRQSNISFRVQLYINVKI